MILSDVMDEIAARLETIPGLRVFAYPPDNVQPDAAIVDMPETYIYDETQRRGMDRMDLPVDVLVGKVSDRASRDRIAPYFDGAGDRSVKTVIEAGTYTTFDSVRVRVADPPFAVWIFAGVSYLAGAFTLDIAGPGGT